MGPFAATVRYTAMTLAAAALAGSSPSGLALADTELRVVASIKPVHSLVSAVMAGVGEPHLLIRGRASPHTFSLRPSDAAAVAGADVVFLIDEALETALAGALESLGTKARITTLAETKGLVRLPFRDGGAFESDAHADHGEEHAKEERDDHGAHDEELTGEEGHHEDDHEKGHAEAGHDRDDHDHGHGTFDTHVWLDPVNARTMTEAIANTLTKADPANAATYRANAQGVLGRLDELTEQITAELTPARGKPFIVFHDGYRYFEDRFGLNAVGSAVVSADRSPGVRRIRELRSKVRELGVVCVFDEPQFDKRIVNVILEGTQARSGTIDPLGAAIEDGPELYFTLLRTMAASFRNCLEPRG